MVFAGKEDSFKNFPWSPLLLWVDVQEIRVHPYEVWMILVFHIFPISGFLLHLWVQVCPNSVFNVGFLLGFPLFIHRLCFLY